VGFCRKLKPVLRETFRKRLIDAGFIDYIPANYFLFNQNIDDMTYIAVDELVYQAITREHDRQFDRLATFALLLSEVGLWRGASPEQAQPSDWARYFVIDNLSKLEKWSQEDYSADRIESYLSRKKNFEGNTRKISTNLSYFFNSGDLCGFSEDGSGEWVSSSVFLALDRYFLIERPANVSLGWCIDVLKKYDIADLVGPETEFKIFAVEASARLFSSVGGLGRFVEDQNNSDDHIVAVLSRDPALYKRLPSICARWLSKRLFVELALSENEFQNILKADFNEEFQAGLARVHNSLPRPTLDGDEVIALFRGEE
jgi:hypothetical protein